VIRYAALVAPYVFVAGLVLGLSLAIHHIFRLRLPLNIQLLSVIPGGPEPVAFTADSYWTFARWTTEQWPWLWALICAAVGLLFSSRVDINEFSIHHFYKNRLVRCYLGASRSTDRKADWFTGFDPNDDLRLADLDNVRRTDTKPYPGPYPLVNCALNLVGGQDLAWQERKATSFVFTPKHCGYDLDRAVLTKAPGFRSEAYVPTSAYYRDGEGPLLGMAMAISGAAANPNMGRATSPALAFLMTVFNVRLGWWIGNPRHRSGAALPGPRLGLPYTALELFGGTDDSRKFINISDGGHFDNLGVYELIRRGCRYIVACDAGQDGRMMYEDLGDLVRRCRTDFGVEIDIAVDRIRERDEAGLSQAHCVVGKIHYLHLPKRGDEGQLVNGDGGPVRPGSRPAHEEGYLVYIKPSVTGDEPQDVLEYYRRIPEFPHQSTADQWFGESQFESYRTLGMHIGEQVFARYQDDDARTVGSLGRLFERLYGYWYPPSLAVNEHATAHATEYSRLMELVRKEPGLRGLDAAMFGAFPAPPDGADPRDEFYVCNALIQLMENVYADLDLEHNWRHPHVEGWMRVFTRWARQPSFRRTWKIAGSTYGERFRNFYTDRLYGRPLRLPRAFVGSRHAGGPADPAGLLGAFEKAMADGAAVLHVEIARNGSGLMVGPARQPADALDLGERLKAWRGQVQLSLQLNAPGMCSEVSRLLGASGWSARDVVVTSFDANLLREARDTCQEVRLGLLARASEGYEPALKQFHEVDADFLGLEQSLIGSERELSLAQEHNVPLVLWPVNAEERLRTFLGHGIVAGVITDDVPLAVSVKRQL
jgi:hypothetical protein